MNTAKEAQLLPKTNDIKDLKSSKNTFSISVYLPLEHDSPASINSNRIQVKNIIHELEKELEKHIEDLEKSKSKILKPLRAMMNDRRELWQRHVRALAIFVNERQLLHYFLPFTCKKQIVVKGDKFHTKLLEEALNNNDRFYILSASHNHAKLYKADQYTIQAVDVKDLPSKGLEETLKIDEYPDSLQFHGLNPVASLVKSKPGVSSSYHGHYNARNVDKKLLRQYFRKIDKAIFNYLKKTNARLIFAGVDYLFPIYRSVNSYTNLEDRSIEGNHQDSNNRELLKQALQVRA